MAVMQNSIIFGGVDSADFGIYIGGEGTFNAPKRDVEMISIPGRNGAFALDKGRFENIKVTYSAFNFEPDLDTFSAQLEAFRNAICSQKGYQRLTDTFHPDEYRMAAYIDGLEIKPVNFNTASTFDITFDCKPQRFLTSGEEPITIGEWRETETASGSIASFEAEDGDAVKSLVADIEPIQDLHGYDKPWSGGAGRNKYAVQIGRDTFTNVNGATHSADSDVLSVSLAPASNSAVETSSSSTLQQLTASLNGTYTYSFDINTATTGTIIIGFASAGMKALGVSPGWSKVSITSSDFNATEKTFRIRNNDAKGRTVQIRNFMIQEGSTATDYEPYSNICPISGYDSVVVNRCGKNLLDSSVLTTFGTTYISSINYNTQGKISVKPSTTYTISFASQVGDGRIFQYDASGNAIGSALQFTTKTYSFTTNEKCVSIGFRYKFSETTATVDDAKAQLELGSTATAYEPYQGNTYSINLNGTRYGGTLDVVSGVLTVTHKLVTLNGTETWLMNQAGYFALQKSSYDATLSTTEAYSDTMICNMLPYVYTQPSSQASFNAITHTIRVSMPNISTLADFKTWLGSNNLQFILQLATPTTVQLTVQEVELLVGLNQVWANSGDVEVEYGTRPSAVYNPTLFESSPMLEVEGYGEIGIGDDTIVVNDTPIGDIYISEGGTITRRDNELSITLPITFETRDLNGGDKFYISDATAAIQSTVKSGYTTDGCSASSFDTAATTNATGTSKAMRIKYSMIFIYNEGTLPAQSDSNSATFFDRWTHGGTAGSNSAIFTISGSYTGGNTLTLTLTIQLSECFDNLTVKSLTLPRVRAKSTKSALGTPTYIDLDIGEAWNADSGEPVSANNAVIFPSTLPTLKPGVTEFSLPGSVTDLKVVPRFWKI